MGWQDRLYNRCLIGADWVEADRGSTIAVTNPADGAEIGTVPRAGRAETARAVAAAHAAFPAFKAMTADARAQLMFKLADKMMAEQAALAELLTREQGKPLAEAMGEIAIGARYIRWFAEEARRIYGDVIPTNIPSRRILVMKEPVGVVGAITPWNFPSSMIARKMGAAMAAGCTMVCKPASQTPYSTLVFGALMLDVGFAPGVLNVVTGTAREIGAELTENPAVRKITFTGSTEVGKTLAAAAMPGMKRVSMELGGNAPFIVFDDANLDLAVDGAIASKLRNAGQTCVCANRIYVQAGVYDAFAAKFAAKVEAMKIGPGMEEGVSIGPLIDANAVTKVQEHINDAVQHGATVLTGNKPHPLGGTFMYPTVVTGVTQDMAVAREETFGPLAPLFKFETEAEVVANANNTEYGLACYFYTADLARAFRVAEALEYGQVGVNEGVITTEVAPFGGVKDSGFGREGSKYGVEDYLNIKYVAIGGLG
jgi:succinate-semialdehyde dehydrogenase/glutarate-semialdehyde dehydrogenase